MRHLFTISLGLSLLIHTLFIFGFSKAEITLPKKKLTSIEVTYQNIQQKETSQNNKKPLKNIRVYKEVRKQAKIKLLTKASDPFGTMAEKMGDVGKLSDRFTINKKKAPKISVMDIDQKVSIPIFKSEKITNPKYLSHKHSIGQRIRERAYIYIDHPDFKTGNVYLSFILLKNGTLKEVKVIASKTDANAYTQKIALKSIKESSPFSPFPDGLEYPEVPFSLLIEFRSE